VQSHGAGVSSAVPSRAPSAAPLTLT